jgi:hypothetical protein
VNDAVLERRIASLETLLKQREGNEGGMMSAKPEVPASVSEPAAVPVSESLVIVSHGQEEKIFPLSEGELRIGQGESSQIPLAEDKYASESHASLKVEGGKIFLEDAGSLNGTWIRVKGRLELKEGDEFLVGTTRLELRRPSA